jgi:hypothetical protein
MILARLLPAASRITQLFVTGLLCLLALGAAQAAEKAAVFDFEIHYGDLVPGAPQKREAEQQRLKTVSQRLRDAMAASGRFDIVDVAPMAAKVRSANLQSCGNCTDDFARELGARLAVTGFVYKVSELILSMTVIVRDAQTGQPVTSAVVDLRGNTDESWKRSIDYLYKNVLSPRLEKAIQ